MAERSPEYRDITDVDIPETQFMGRHNGYLGDMGIPADPWVDWPHSGPDITADARPVTCTGNKVTFSARTTLAMAGCELLEDEKPEDKVLVSPGSHLDSLA